MLIELLTPLRNKGPIELPDGSLCQFNEDDCGRHIAEVPNDQALLLLRHKGSYRRLPEPEPEVMGVSETSAETPSLEVPATRRKKAA
jgi:hypothetical protein